MRKLVFVLLFSFSALFSQYVSVSDRVARRKPPLPGIGPAGSVIQDPTYGTPILRVTDNVQTLPGQPNVSFYTTAGGFVNAWNTDSTLFYIRSDRGFIAYRFDPVNFRASRLGEAYGANGGLMLNLDGPWFSYLYPNILYGMKGRAIAQYDFSTNTYTDLLNLNEVTSFQQYVGALTVGGDDRMFVVAFGGIQDTHPYILAWDRASGARQLVNLRDSTLNGRPVPIPADVRGVHSVYVDRSGRFVSINDGKAIWDIQAGTFTAIADLNSGHEVLGYGTRINQSGIRIGADSDSRGFTFRTLDAAGLNTSMRQLINPAPEAPYAWGAGGHWSWNNVKAYAPLPPMVGSFFREAWAASTPWKAWDDEIVAVSTDGSPTVWRFAHHRSIYESFWDSPRGNVSQDGRFFVFTSNWEGTLGRNSTGQTRRDVFLLNLMGSTAAQPWTPAPAVPTPVPVAPAPAPIVLPVVSPPCWNPWLPWACQ